MNAWDGLRQVLRARAPVLRDEPAGLEFTFGARRFTIRLAERALAMIVVETTYAYANRDAGEMMDRNRTAPIGALHRAGGDYILRQSLPVAGLTWATFDAVVRAMAAFADRARPRPSDTTAMSSLFDGFATT